jgi:hypothetical protein
MLFLSIRFPARAIALHYHAYVYRMQPKHQLQHPTIRSTTHHSVVHLSMTTKRRAINKNSTGNDGNGENNDDDSKSHLSIATDKYYQWPFK